MPILSGAEFNKKYFNPNFRFCKALIKSDWKTETGKQFKLGLNVQIINKESDWTDFRFETIDKIAHDVCSRYEIVIIQIPNDAQVNVYCSDNFYSTKIFITEDKILFDEYLCIVNKYGYALRGVPKEFKTRELCLTALKRSGGAFSCIPDEFKSDDEFLDLANLNCIPIDQRTYNRCKKAVMKNGRSIEYVPKEHLNEELCELAIKTDDHDEGSSLEFVPPEFKTQKLCELAMRYCVSALEFIPKEWRSQELCELAMKHDFSMIEFIPKEHLTTSMLKKFVSELDNDDEHWWELLLKVVQNVEN